MVCPVTMRVVAVSGRSMRAAQPLHRPVLPNRRVGQPSKPQRHVQTLAAIDTETILIGVSSFTVVLMTTLALLAYKNKDVASDVDDIRTEIDRLRDSGSDNARLEILERRVALIEERVKARVEKPAKVGAAAGGKRGGVAMDDLPASREEADRLNKLMAGSRSRGTPGDTKSITLVSVNDAGDIVSREQMLLDENKFQQLLYRKPLVGWLAVEEGEHPAVEFFEDVQEGMTYVEWEVGKLAQANKASKALLEAEM